ncbi:hypothetical protein WJX81_007215 [Elliptochloris bilobata]|uniref:Dioxygenase n=1 Tax=Elliptochloris bilobata TaxID=381761 RepID=A0AAW1QTY6_9CHLO
MDVFTRQDFDNFLKGYQSQLNEVAFWVDTDAIEGTVPAELEGTLLRNGPGLFEIGGKSISQPLDGDGQVSTFAIKNGRVFFRNRFVRTEALMREQEAQKMLYRGAFSVGNPAGGLFFNPFDFSVKGIANTSVLAFGGKLLALYERDLPYEMDAELKTIGHTDLGCSIDTPKFFGAHHRVELDAHGHERLVGFNASEEANSALVNFFEYDEDFRLLQKAMHRLPGASFGFFHDFLVTENYYVLLENPISLDLAKLLTRYMFGRACLAECLEYRDDRRTRVHLLRRPGRQGAEHAIAETEPFFSFHHVNAFEAPGGKVVIDTCAMKSGIKFDVGFEGASEAYYQQPAGRATLTRLVMDVATQQVTRHELAPDRAAELPSPLAPPRVGRAHTHQYLAASRVPGALKWGPQQGVMKVSVSPDWGVSAPAAPDGPRRAFWFPADRAAFAQEPVFVPRREAAREDDGWVLTLVYSATEHRTSLVILDAQSMKQVAAVHLPLHLPYGIHGSWSNTFFGPSKAFRPTSYCIKHGVSANGRPKYAK